MSKNKTIKIAISDKRDRSWSAEDHQNFADRNVLRSNKFANRKRVANKRACRDRSRWD
jgi:hypothetical protein